MSRAGRILLLVAAAVPAACGAYDDTTSPGEGNGSQGGDAVPPTVVSTMPSDGATGVSPTTRVTVTFSEPVVLPSDSAEPLDVSVGGRETPGAVEQTGSTVLTFTARYPLDPGTDYEVHLPAAALSDTAGNALAAPYAWSFRAAGEELPALEAGALLEHVGVLAHDSMRGRDAGSPEELAAARYMADWFRDAGLEPGAPDYLQSFPVYQGSEVESQNVIAVLPGAGELAEEWVVVGAHYDHLGVLDGEVYNGADDNASGTAVVLELARALAEHAEAGGLGDVPRRSVAFQGYGAEEVGLVGSYYYCNNPTRPMSGTVGMLNMDMVGRLRNRQLQVIGPTLDTPLGDLFPHVNRTGLSLIYDRSLINRSDQRCFLDRGIPVAFLHTGLHGLYHEPGDDVEVVDEEGMAEVGNLALRALVKLMLATDRLE